MIILIIMTIVIMIMPFVKRFLDLNFSKILLFIIKLFSYLRQSTIV